MKISIILMFGLLVSSAFPQSQDSGIVQFFDEQYFQNKTDYILTFPTSFSVI